MQFVVSEHHCIYRKLFSNRTASLVSRFDPRTDSWFEISSMNEARQRFDLEVIGDNMFALGGWDDSGKCLYICVFCIWNIVDIRLSYISWY